MWLMLTTYELRQEGERGIGLTAQFDEQLWTCVPTDRVNLSVRNGLLLPTGVR